MNTIQQIMELADHYAMSYGDNINDGPNRQALRAAIEQAIRDEREACAKVCDERASVPFPQSTQGFGYSFGREWTAARAAEKMCAGAIRQRSET